MSRRYMKKVYGGGEILDNENDSSSDTEIPNKNKSKCFNVYDLLNQNPESEEKDSEQQVENDESSVEEKKRKKRKKRRKRTENLRAQQHKCDSGSDNEIDEIEKSIREVNKLLGEPSPGCSTDVTNADAELTSQKSKEDILKVQHKHLTPYNELKKIFGVKTVKTEQHKRRSRGYLKKTWLVAAKEGWPPVGKSGLSMTIDNSMDTQGEFQYFVYEHSSSYRQVQQRFLQAVESLDPENVISIINTHSYHVDTLLQIAELCKLSEDLAMAAEFTERALYCLECAFHPLFNITTARCRLDYRKQQNRALFITLFKHLNFLGGRACYRTSLELCKLLLSLDPEGDPLAIVLSIDFYALRSREYEWFIEFCDLWESSRNLLQLPNIAYSLALAHFYLKNQSAADELLQYALIMYPGVLWSLLDKCGIQPDQRVTNHTFFTTKADKTTSPALEKLQNLYVVRNYSMWKEACILPWLEQTVKTVLDRVDANDEYVRYCELKRGKRYQGRLPKNILRHIILVDIKDVIVNVQEIQNEGSVMSHDPLPPADSIDIYKKPRANARTTTESNSNLLSLFFSSLFTDIDGDVAAAALNGLNVFEENDERQ